MSGIPKLLRELRSPPVYQLPTNPHNPFQAKSKSKGKGKGKDRGRRLQPHAQQSDFFDDDVSFESAEDVAESLQQAAVGKRFWLHGKVTGLSASFADAPLSASSFWAPLSELEGCDSKIKVVMLQRCKLDHE